MVGEVWVASGQSNMAWKMEQDSNWGSEQSSAGSLPDIRILSRVGAPLANDGDFNANEVAKMTE